MIGPGRPPLAGRAAVVTGASRGIGFAVARTLAGAGASVMMVSRRRDRLEASAAEIGCAWTAADVADPDAATDCVRDTVDRFGSVDILVNNAGASPYFGPLLGLDAHSAERTTAVNQWAPVRWVQAAWEASMQSGGGAIVNVASIGAHIVEPGLGYYNASKAALDHLTRHLADELGPRVRVNAVSPGLVRTDLGRPLTDPFGDEIARSLPLGRLGEPDDIAQAVLFLVSDASSWITGQTLLVDGGGVLRTTLGEFGRRLFPPPG
ncbi:MAG TPA: SDR family oxidoreductase [Acidimicrobiales bacterium]|nr:SDR family oxidoreductase [Acidimicrobiales bacterium]